MNDSKEKREVRTAIGKGLKTEFLGENTGMKKYPSDDVPFEEAVEIKEICVKTINTAEGFFFLSLRWINNCDNKRV